MKLSKLLNGITVSKMFYLKYGQFVVTQDLEINCIRYDSRKVQNGDIFVAIRGAEFDGHNFIKNAVSNGASVVVLEDDSILNDSFFLHSGVMKIVVPNSRIALAKLSANYFNNPSERLSIFGVTGTNGKTTTTYLLKSILENTGKKTGLLGTIAYQIGNQTITATHTTPESFDLNELFSQMLKASCSAAVMEVSSHALAQHRVHAIKFTGAIFTNLTQDHLDYHITMEKYFEAKKSLFDSLPSSSFAVINIDDKWGQKICNSTKANILTYGIHESADVRAKNIITSTDGIKFSLLAKGNEIIIESNLIGTFNVYNLLAACSVGIALDIPLHTLKEVILKTTAAPGRFEQINSPKGWKAIIDYAHTPDALEKALTAIHEMFSKNQKGKIITVFGCGGNRDRGKRPKMAQIASTLSDVTIITSDNPRNEEPENIINEVIRGIKTGNEFYSEVDRKKAIHLALDLARKNDVVLIAGKGHEDYQIIGNQKIHFNDREVVEEYISSHK